MLQNAAVLLGVVFEIGNLVLASAQPVFRYDLVLGYVPMLTTFMACNGFVKLFMICMPSK